jgi:thymidylate kinase
MFVVLLGPDGSGKTTIARDLSEFWKRDYGATTVQIHGGFHLLPELKNLRRAIAWLCHKPMAPEVDFTGRHSGVSVAPHSLTRSLCYLLYYSWDYILSHIPVFYHKGKDRLIVADRYFYDYFFQLRNSKLPHRLLDAIRRVIAQPDLIVCVERDAEAIYADKDELTVDEIRRQQAVLRAVVAKLPNAVLVRADAGAQAAADCIQGHILRVMTGRVW